MATFAFVIGPACLGFLGGWVARSQLEWDRRNRAVQRSRARHPSMRPQHMIDMEGVDW